MKAEPQGRPRGGQPGVPPRRAFWTPTLATFWADVEGAVATGRFAVAPHRAVPGPPTAGPNFDQVLTGAAVSAAPFRILADSGRSLRRSAASPPRSSPRRSGGLRPSGVVGARRRRTPAGRRRPSSAQVARLGGPLVSSSRTLWKDSQLAPSSAPVR